MNIGDMREWLKALPSSFDDMHLVFRKYDELNAKKESTNEEKDETSDYYYALDAPIVSGYIDEENRECCFLDSASRDFIIKMNAKAEESESSENSDELPK